MRVAAPEVEWISSKHADYTKEVPFMPNSHAAAFFHGTVRPTVEEFFQEHLSLRRGRLAAIVLFHMADYWALEKGIKLWAAHKTLIEECPDFAILRDVANASKHDVLIKGDASERIVTSSRQVQGTPGIFGAPFGQGMFSEAASILITLNDGTQRPLIGVVRASLEMWTRKLGGQE